PASPAPTSPTVPTTSAPQRVGHVFVIVLENENFESTFGASPGSPYLAKNLTAEGRLLTEYYAIGHNSLANYIAMVSGQAPNVETQADCANFAAMRPGVVQGGQAVGQGCVYPAPVKTLGDQLTTAGRNWRMYAEDMAASPGTAPTSCRHPAEDTMDPWQTATATDQYATRHVPFVYFHSIIDDAKSCSAHVVDLALLRGDLANGTAMPALAFITPDLCSDGHDSPCADGRPGGYASIDAFLREWVPRITNSTAYKTDGLLIIAFDEADSRDDTSACCNEPTGFNTVSPGLGGPGGGKTGAILVSRCIPAGSTSDAPVNHYGLLRTIDDIFGVPNLGYADDAGSKDFDLGACRPGPA
ncbi:MAG: alkaline phosphatase family protein, partial [Thermoplasmatota archaeon]